LTAEKCRAHSYSGLAGGCMMKTIGILGGMGPMASALFYRMITEKTAAEKYGLYKTQYSSSSDYEFMIRILKDGTLKLGYVPKILIKMFYGGTSSAGIKGYSNNTVEAYQALSDNKVRFPLIIIIMRIWRTLWQYLVAPRMQRKIEI